jgi:hypothetical protein
MNDSFTESVVEQAALDWLAGLGWQTAFGPEIVDSERGGDFRWSPDAERIVGRAV